MGTTNPHGTIIQPLSLTAQTVGGKPVFLYGGTRLSAETLFHSHAATIMKSAVTNLQVYPGETPATATFKGNYSILNQLSECVKFDFLSNQQ